MRIRSLYIENFGGLHQHEMTFDDGLNVLCLPNGWGKSTLSVFIKAMLYGLPVSTKRSLIENERKRYTPWQGGVFGGSMVIELDGRSYRIERTFGTKESEDTLSVTDPETGLPSDVSWTAESRLGEMLLGVDAAAYERSTYLSQRQIDGDDGELSIHAKLNRLLDATDDLACYDAAMELLDKQRKYYTVSGGRRGAIADTEASILEIKEQIEQARRAAQEAEHVSQEIALLERSLAKNEQEQRQLHVRETEHHRRGERVAQYKHYHALSSALSQKQAQLDAMLRGVGGESPTDEQIDALKTAQKDVEDQKRALTLLEDEARELIQANEQAAATNVPDEQMLPLLRVAAEQAQRTEMLYQTQKESTVTDCVSEENLPEASALARMRDFCVRYGSERTEAVAQVEEHAHVVKSLQAAAARGKKRAGLLGVVAALLWICTAGSFLLELPQGGFGVITQISTLLFGALLLAGAVWLGLQGCKAAAAMPAEREALTTAQERIAVLDEAWQAMLGELRTYGDACDTQQMLTLIGALEQRLAQRVLLQREAAQQSTRLRMAAEQAMQAYATLCDLWRDYGEPPTALDAPVALERLRIACEEHTTRQTRLHELRQKIDLQTIALRQAQTLVQGQLSRYPEAPEEGIAVPWLMQQRQGIVTLYEELAAHQSALEQFGAQTDMEPTAIETQDVVSASESEDFDQTRTLLEQAHNDAERQMALLQRQAERLLEQAARLDTLEPQLSDAELLLEQQRAALQTIELTRTYMEKAKLQLSERYLMQMKQSFAKYHAALTEKDALAFTMDGSFRIKLRAGGVQRSTESFSVGQRDVLSLCARLSLVDALFENETPFLILDDPFVNMDDATVIRAYALLTIAAKNYQILYLTCHSSRAGGADKESEV